MWSWVGLWHRKIQLQKYRGFVWKIITRFIESIRCYWIRERFKADYPNVNRIQHHDANLAVDSAPQDRRNSCEREWHTRQQKQNLFFDDETAYAQTRTMQKWHNDNHQSTTRRKKFRCLVVWELSRSLVQKSRLLFGARQRFRCV